MFLILLTTVSARPVVSPIFAEGAGKTDSNFMVIPRWPMYKYFTAGDNTFNLTITNPEENVSYPYSTLNITVVYSGNTSAIDCLFKINSNDWNVLDLGGDMTTFPHGENTLYVLCNDLSDNVGEDQVSFTILGGGGGGFWKVSKGMILILFVLLVCFSDRSNQ